MNQTTRFGRATESKLGRLASFGEERGRVRS